MLRQENDYFGGLATRRIPIGRAIDAAIGVMAVEALGYTVDFAERYEPEQ